MHLRHYSRHQSTRMGKVSPPPPPPGFTVQYREQKIQTVQKGKSLPKKGHAQVRRERLWVASSVVGGNSSIREGNAAAGKQAGGGPQEAMLTISSAPVLPEGHSPHHGRSRRPSNHPAAHGFSISPCKGSGR